MEVQLTIFDVYKDLDAEETQEKTLYNQCIIPGIHFENCHLHLLRGYAEKIVVDSYSGVALFGITIIEKTPDTFTFSYTALDRYWKGRYETKDLQEIRTSIRKVSKDLREEGL